MMADERYSIFVTFTASNNQRFIIPIDIFDSYSLGSSE